MRIPLTYTDKILIIILLINVVAWKTFKNDNIGTGRVIILMLLPL